MALNSTYAVRLGSIAAGIAWIVLLVAPGSRAAESSDRDTTPDPTSAPAATASPITVATTLPAPATIPPTTVAVAAVAPTTKLPSTTAKVPASATVRTFSVRDIVGLAIDRDTTWIAIATVLVVDQSNLPAPGVDVHAAWSYGPTLASCRTDTGGKCSMYLSAVPENLSAVTITVTAPLSGSKSISRVVS